MLQQSLPFTVLKRTCRQGNWYISIFSVATVPTVHGIETCHSRSYAQWIKLILVATAPTVYGIVTQCVRNRLLKENVATVLTVHGIET